jgi:hypothetical protein
VKSGPGSRAFHHGVVATDYKRNNAAGIPLPCEAFAAHVLTPPLHDWAPLDRTTTTRNGGRPHEIPPFEPVVITPTSAPSKSRHFLVQARIHSDNMAQGKGSAAIGREAGDVGQEKHRSDAAQSNPNILCKHEFAASSIQYMLTVARNQTKWCPSSSDP